MGIEREKQETKPDSNAAPELPKIYEADNFLPVFYVLKTNQSDSHLKELLNKIVEEFGLKKWVYTKLYKISLLININ